MTTLLIVESPTKKKHIQHFLGSEYNVQASVGHIRDLPERQLGVDKESLSPVYEVMEGKKDVVAMLKKAAKGSDMVLLATDPDREGEAISWHLKEQLQLQEGKYQRVTFHEITEKAVRKALTEPRSLDMNLVRAQETRRVMDRLCGYLVSGKLTTICHSKEALSAGRTQSPALRLVVEREREIRNFKPKTHFGARLHFEGSWFAEFITKPFVPEGEDYLLDESIALAASQVKEVTVVSCEQKEKNDTPPPFFTTSTLQQAASASLHMNVKTTSKIAQSLFENGFITYIRTDNPNISDEFFEQAKDWLSANNTPYISKNRKYKAKSGAQEAHEAIRPTDPSRQTIEGTKDEQALYRLIWLRTLAACMPDAVYTVREVVLTGQIEKGPVTYKGKGRTIKVPGWKQLTAKDAAFSEDEEESDNPIPTLDKDTKLSVKKGEVLKKQTKPPTRYDEAGLTRKLEAMEIGRPATYANIISTIEDRKYVQLDKKRKLVPTAIGETVCDVLKNYFSFMNYHFTKEMEENLDKISEGKDTYEKEVGSLWILLEQELGKMMEESNITHECPVPGCGGTAVKYDRKDGSGSFWICSACEAAGRNKFLRDENGVPVADKTAACPNPDCKGQAVQKKRKDGSGYFWVCDTCDKEGRHKFYPDKDGVPVLPTESKTADCPHPDCKGQAIQKKRKDGSGFFWICETCDKEGRYKFYPDKDNKPVYEEKITGKCPCCGGTATQGKRQDNSLYWKCKTCGYFNDENGKPETTYICPSCDKKSLVKKTSKKGTPYFSCNLCKKGFSTTPDGNVGKEFKK